MTTDVERRASAAAAMFQGYILAAAILAYFGQGFIKFANPDSLFGGACIFATGIGMLYSDFVTNGRWIHKFSVLPIVGGGLWIAINLTHASQQSNINDYRCFKIQRDMLMPTPARSDDAEIFQALGCRIQGDDDIQFPKPIPTVKGASPTK